MGCKRILFGCIFVLLAGSFASVASADDWPQWRGPKSDGVWRESGIVEKFDSSKLKPLWRAKISGGYSGPTVADNRVYVTDRVTKPESVERVHCFDAKTGENIWTHTYPCEYKRVGYPAGPRASVTVSDGRAYSLGSTGFLHCLDAAKGDVIWSKDLRSEYNIRMPIWGIASAPFVDGGLVFVQIGGEDGACIVAFDKVTGTEKWRALDDPAGYSAPIIISQAGKRVLVYWTGANIVGLDPKTGKVYWKYTFKPKRMVMSIADPVFDNGYLFFTAFFDGSLMLKVDPDELAVEKVWRRRGKNEEKTDALHSTIGTPILQGKHVYGVDSYGQLRCLDRETGERIWESLDAVPKARWANIYLVKHKDKVWMFNERGELIISKLSPAGFKEISRAKLIAPTEGQLDERGGVTWSHPAFANKHVYARNDNELVCVSLAAGSAKK
ncbi:MAG: PQQ-binding-like beta-propeller repeat protein [Planctomycetota bacterium]|jgi:outer membrane protein assembly factor BamB